MSNRRARRAKPKKVKRQGHPARLTRADKRQRFWQPDASEANVQTINRLMRDELRTAHPDDGLILGPLRVAARYAAPQLASSCGLAVEHEGALTAYLVGAWGEMLHDFDRDAYLAWRAGSAERIREHAGP